MPSNYTSIYPLASNGAIRNWLRCGVLASPLPELAEVVPADGSAFGSGKRWTINYWAYDPESAVLKKRVYQKLSPFDSILATDPARGREGFGGQHWDYARADEDDVIDFSRFNFNPALMQGWLYALLDTPRAQTYQAELITIGPARVRLNNELVAYFNDHFSYVAVQRIPITLELRAGLNPLLLHGEMLGWREARLALGLRFLTMPQECRVGVPIDGVHPHQWETAEAALNAVQLKQFAFPQLPGKITLAADAQPATLEVEVSLPADQFGGAVKETDTARATLNLQAGESADLPITPEIARQMATLPGENTLTVTFRPADGTPIQLKREIWASASQFSDRPYGTYRQRQQEAMEHLANMAADVPSCICAILLGKIAQVPAAVIDLALSFLDNRRDCADFYAIGLLALLYRIGDDPQYAAAIAPTDRQRIERSFLRFKYWIDEPGIDAMCYFTENHQVLFHVAAYLAGQRWQERTFINSGRSGREQMNRNRPRIEEWIRRRLRGNFSEWDSNAYMALDAYAMLALVEFANAPKLRALAEQLLHKIFFLLASQSYRGSLGSTHGRCYVGGLKSSRFENTSGLGRIGWGMGVFNGETRATSLLAISRRYRLPDVLQQIGGHLPEVLTTRARSLGNLRPQFDMKAGTWDVRTLTRRTPDGMLSAALDHRPGAMGVQEHLWQAMFSPEAVIFTTYPGNSQEHGHARPNFWAGSARLPRVGMVDRTVMSLYKLEAGVGLGFTHAYFPAAMFDEWHLDGAWAFVRHGDGYAALWTDGDLLMTASGKHVEQELRSSGKGEHWLCHVGRRAEDGDFAAFIRRVKSTIPTVEADRLRWNVDGKALEFGWTGALLVDSKAEDWENYPHYDNLYTHTPMDATEMRIEHAGNQLTLSLD